MPPAQESKREQILANIVTTLQGINGGAAYWHTIATVTRDERDILNDSRTGWPMILVSQNEQASHLEDMTNLEIVENMQLEITGLAETQSGIKNATKVERLIADIIKALETDGSRGGLADQTIIAEVTPQWNEESTIVAASILVQVKYYRNRGAP